LRLVQRQFDDLVAHLVREAVPYPVRPGSAILQRCTTMKAGDVTDTLTMALQASGCDSARVLHKPKLLSDNGPSYVSSDLAEWLSDKGMEHTRGAPCHPQTQGK